MWDNCEKTMNYNPVNGRLQIPFNHNVEVDLELRLLEAEKHFERFLIAMGLDIRDPNLSGTARRVSKMYLMELFAGRWQEPPEITKFNLPNSSIPHDMQVIGPITLKSTCSHHFMPIVGQCWIGVLFPKHATAIPGLSKYARIVEWFARRPQIQEQLTEQIKEYLVKKLELTSEDSGCAVIIKASHGCMTQRGVNETDCLMTTSSLHGKFFHDNIKSEFIKLAGIHHGNR